uniref:ANK_REP_REGION domain-containing protein n=1 Tax=Strongyloides papillosus TaxID=174720 RepID=A0A0N5BJU8_STREA
MSAYERNSRFSTANKYGSNSNLSISSRSYTPLRSSRASSNDRFSSSINRNERASSVTNSYTSPYKTPSSSYMYNTSSSNKYSPSSYNSSIRVRSGSTERSTGQMYTPLKKYSTGDRSNIMSTSFSIGDRKQLAKPPTGRSTNSYTSNNNSSISRSLYSSRNYSPVKSSSYSDIRNKVLSASSSTYTPSTSSSGYKSYQTTRSRTPSLTSYSNYKTRDYTTTSRYDDKEYLNNRVDEGYKKICKKYSSTNDDKEHLSKSNSSDDITTESDNETLPSEIVDLKIVGKIIDNIESEMEYDRKYKDLEIIPPKIDPKLLSNPTSAIDKFLLNAKIEENKKSGTLNDKAINNVKKESIALSKLKSIKMKNEESLNEINNNESSKSPQPFSYPLSTTSKDKEQNMLSINKSIQHNQNDKKILNGEKNTLIPKIRKAEDIITQKSTNQLTANTNILSRNMDVNNDTSISTTIILPDIPKNDNSNRLQRKDRINEHLEINKEIIKPPLLLVTQPSLPSTPRSPNSNVNWNSCFEINKDEEVNHEYEVDEVLSDEFYSDEEVTDESYDDDEELTDYEKEYSTDMSETFTFSLAPTSNNNPPPKGDLYPIDGSSLHIRSTTPLSISSYSSSFDFNPLEPPSSRTDSRGRVMRESMAKPAPVFTVSVHYDGMPEWEATSDDSGENEFTIRPHSSANGIYLSADDYSTDGSYDGERFHDTVDVGCTLTLCDRAANGSITDDSDSYYYDEEEEAEDEDEEYSYEEEEYSYEEEYCQEYDPDVSPYMTEEEMEEEEEEKDMVERLSVSPYQRFASPKPASEVGSESVDELSSAFELPSHELSDFIVENVGPIATAALKLEPTFTIPVVDNNIDVHDHLPELDAEYEEESSSFVYQESHPVEVAELKLEPTFTNPISDNKGVYYDRACPMRTERPKTDFARKAVIQPNKLETATVKTEKVEMKEDTKVENKKEMKFEINPQLNEINKKEVEEIKTVPKTQENIETKKTIPDKSDVRKSSLNMNEIERRKAEEKKNELEKKRTRGFGTVSTMTEKFKQAEAEAMTYKRSSVLAKRDEPRIKKPLPALIKPVINDTFEKQLEELKKQIRNDNDKMQSQFIDASKGLFESSEDAKRKLESEKYKNNPDTERLLKAGEEFKKWKENKAAEDKKRLDEEENSRKKPMTKIQQIQEAKKKAEEESLKNFKESERKRVVRKIVKKEVPIVDNEIKPTVQPKINNEVSGNKTNIPIIPKKEEEVPKPKVTKPTIKVEPTVKKPVNTDALDEVMTMLAPSTINKPLPVKKLVTNDENKAINKTEPNVINKPEPKVWKPPTTTTPETAKIPQSTEQKPSPVLSKIQNKIARAQDANNPRNRYGQRRRTQELVNFNEIETKPKIRSYQYHRKNRFIKKPYDIDQLMGWDKENTTFEKMEAMFQRENKNKIQWNDNIKIRRVPLQKIWISQLKDIDKLYKGSELRDIERTVNEI